MVPSWKNYKKSSILRITIKVFAQEGKGAFSVNELFAVGVLLYSVPLVTLLLTWKKPLQGALGTIVASEIVGILLFFPVYALVGMLSWQWFRWGGVRLQDILSFWEGGSMTAAVWIWPGVAETALVLLLRWVVAAVRQKTALAEQEGSL